MFPIVIFWCNFMSFRLTEQNRIIFQQINFMHSVKCIEQLSWKWIVSRILFISVTSRRDKIKLTWCHGSIWYCTSQLMKIWFSQKRFSDVVNRKAKYRICTMYYINLFKCQWIEHLTIALTWCHVYTSVCITIRCVHLSNLFICKNWYDFKSYSKRFVKVD